MKIQAIEDFERELLLYFAKVGSPKNLIDSFYELKKDYEMKVDSAKMVEEKLEDLLEKAGKPSLKRQIENELERKKNAERK